MRVVIDTGVLVSGLIRPRGTTGEVVRALRDGKFTVLYSNETIMEVIDVMGQLIKIAGHLAKWMNCSSTYSGRVYASTRFYRNFASKYIRW